MKRIGAVLMVLAMAVWIFGACCGFASAEETEPAGTGETVGTGETGETDEPGEDVDVPLATQTDLCPHEHTHRVIFFDYPDYRAINRFVHNVIGSAVVNVVCDDCGEVLTSERVDRIEELREHTYSKKGVCRLCGYVRPDDAAGVNAAVSNEQVLVPVQGEDGVFRLSVTKAEIAALPDSVEILVFRPEESLVALAVRLSPAVTDMIALGPLTAELAPENENTIAAALRAGVPGGENELPAEDCALRLFDTRTGLNAAFTGEDDIPAAAECAWVEGAAADEGYWNVSWMGDGRYTFDQ